MKSKKKSVIDPIGDLKKKLLEADFENGILERIIKEQEGHIKFLKDELERQRDQADKFFKNWIELMEKTLGISKKEVQPEYSENDSCFIASCFIPHDN